MCESARLGVCLKIVYPQVPKESHYFFLMRIAMFAPLDHPISHIGTADLTEPVQSKLFFAAPDEEHWRLMWNSFGARYQIQGHHDMWEIIFLVYVYFYSYSSFLYSDLNDTLSTSHQRIADRPRTWNCLSRRNVVSKTPWRAPKVFETIWRPWPGDRYTAQ